MTNGDLRRALRRLKGAALSIMVALELTDRHVLTVKEIRDITGYSGPTVSAALSKLQDMNCAYSPGGGGIVWQVVHAPVDIYWGEQLILGASEVMQEAA